MTKNIFLTAIIIVCCLLSGKLTAQKISTSDYYFFQDGKTQTAGVDTARFLLYSSNYKASQWKRNSRRVSFYWKFQIINITASNDTLYNIINRVTNQYMCAMADGTIQDLSLSRSDDNDVKGNRWKLRRVSDPQCPAGAIAVAMEAFDNNNLTTGTYLKIIPNGSNSYNQNDLQATTASVNNFNWFLIKNEEAPTPPPFTARVCQDASELKLDVYRRDNAYLNLSDYTMSLYDSTSVQINANNIPEGLVGRLYQVYLPNANKPSNVVDNKGSLTLPLVAASRRSAVYESSNGYFMVQASYTTTSGSTCVSKVPLNVRIVSNTAVWKPERDASSNIIASDNWNDDNNWTVIDTSSMDMRYVGGISTTPRIASIPMGCTNVFIPGFVSDNADPKIVETFPVLKNYKDSLTDARIMTEKRNLPTNKILQTNGTYRYDPQQGFNSNPVCNDIVFKMGGELGRQDLLTYQRAFVELNFGETGGNNAFKNHDHGVSDTTTMYSCVLNRSRWHMLSIPLKKVVTGDYMFAGFPYVYYRFFDEASPETNKVAVGNWSTSFNTLNVEPRTGQGVLYWVNGNANGNTKPFFNQKNLDKIHGVVRFPSFQNDLVMDGGSMDARTNHIFNPGSGISRFIYFDNANPEKYMSYPGWSDTLSTVSGNPYSYDRYRVVDENQNVKSKSNASYRFYPEILKSDGTFAFPQGDFTVTLSPPKRPQGASSDPATRFVCIGNPFMSQLDFYTFAKANFGVQASGYTYQVFTSEKSYLLQSISPDGTTTVGSQRFIPPMQSFIMEVPFQTTTVKFNATTMSTACSPNYANVSGLRSEQPRDETLHIEASNSYGKSEAIIAKKDWASDQFIPMEDKNKLLSFDGSIPDVYTMSDSYALACNFIQTEDISIPLKINTANVNENVNLHFRGANDFSAEEIELVDGVSGVHYDLRQKDTFTLSAKELMEEGRYFIRFSSGQATNLDNHQSGGLNIYVDSNKMLHVVSSPDSPIQEVLLFNAQGQKLGSSGRIEMTSWTFDFSGISGVFFAKVKTSKTTTNQKILVH